MTRRLATSLSVLALLGVLAGVFGISEFLKERTTTPLTPQATSSRASVFDAPQPASNPSTPTSTPEDTSSPPHEAPREERVIVVTHPGDLPSATTTASTTTPILTATTSSSTTSASSTRDLLASTTLPHYIEIVGGCGSDFNGEPCVHVRDMPDREGASIVRLRSGAVLRVHATTTLDREDNEWYKVIFDPVLRYPERVTSEWYIANDPRVALFVNEGDRDIRRTTPTSTKEITIDLSSQTLFAYDSNGLFLSSPISTGVELTPTPVGEFRVLRKTPSRYMQGPIPDVTDQYYDVPGVPWNLYFTEDGSVIHGAYWHDKFGRTWSHGCVNLPPHAARTLYEWADLGMRVSIVL